MHKSLFIVCLFDQQTHIWISAEVRSCALQYVCLSTKPQPLAFSGTMLGKWLKGSSLQCTLQAAHFSLAFSSLLLKFKPITWKTLRNYCPVQHTLITILIFFFSLLVLKNRYDLSLSDEKCKKIRQTWSRQSQKAVSIDRMPKHIDENNLYIGFDIIFKIACFVTSWKSFVFFILYADSMGKFSYGFLCIFVSTGLFPLGCHLYKWQ